MITLASGGVALSITFLQILKPAPAIPSALKAAWLALVATIVFTILSMATSRWLVENEIAALDEDLKNLPEAFLGRKPEHSRLRARSKRISRATNTLSIIAGGAFVVGMIGLIYFAATTREGADVRAEPATVHEEERGSGLRAPAASAESGTSGGEEGIRAAASASAPGEPAASAADQPADGEAGIRAPATSSAAPAEVSAHQPAGEEGVSQKSEGASGLRPDAHVK